MKRKIVITETDDDVEVKVFFENRLVDIQEITSIQLDLRDLFVKAMRKMKSKIKKGPKKKE